MARLHGLTAVLAAAALVGACDGLPFAPDPPVSIELDAGSGLLTQGRPRAVTLLGFSADGDTVPVESAEWRTSDPAIATVSADGIVLAADTGRVTVSVDADGLTDAVELWIAPDSIPLFSRPFEGSFPIWNAFDHDLPFWSGRSGSILTWRGTSVRGLEGHDGYDWPMPEGTPLLAAASGVVWYAEAEPPWPCPLQNNEDVSALVVVLRHEVPGGEQFLTLYVHLSRIDVAEGDTVHLGQVIGLSGNTGCSTGPHLHFGVYRDRYHRAGSPGVGEVTDPSGWQGTYADPWLVHPEGAASSALWVPGAGPHETAATAAAPVPPVTTDVPAPRSVLRRILRPPHHD